MSREGARLVLVELAAPRGFGAAYRRTAKEPAEPAVLVDLLGLIGYEVAVEKVQAWPLLKRIQAEVHAVNVHLRASDNPLQAHPRPDWMPEPWQGPRREDERVADLPGGTLL